MTGFLLLPIFTGLKLTDLTLWTMSYWTVKSRNGDNPESLVLMGTTSISGKNYEEGLKH